MNFCFNAPLNSVSFGQVATHLLRGFFRNNISPSIYPIGGQVDLSSQSVDEKFKSSLEDCIKKFLALHDRNTACLKLWHLNGAIDSPSKTTNLLTFHELDSLTNVEKNVCRSMDRVFITSNFSKEVLKSNEIDSVLVPLAFDKFNFFNLNKKYYSDERIVFNLFGKFEKRKHHKKTIQAWIKRFGNDKKYNLQCALYNSFMSEDQNKALFRESIGPEAPWNVQFVNFLPQNKTYNDYLNSGDIILGMSGGEGWGLPEFHSLGIGKHAVILNAHSYKEWANDKNSVLVEPSGKEDVYDNIFFHKGQDWNQGQIFSWEEDEFIHACETAITRVEESRVNKEGLNIPKDFSLDKTIDVIKNNLAS